MPVYVKETADRCLHCKVPQCQKGCPVHTNIPQVISLFQENKLREAGKILFENNPMSLVCTTVSAADTAFWVKRARLSTSA